MKICNDYPRVCRLKRDLERKRLSLAAARARYCALKAKAEGGVRRLSLTPAAKGDKELVLAALTDCKTEMDAAAEALRREKARLRGLLDEIGDPVNETLLKGELLEGDGMKVLRHTLGMSKQGVYYRANMALRELEELMEAKGYGKSEF